MIDEDFFIPVNEFQTPITGELLNQYPDEVQEWFIDAINNIDFIKNLISPNRKRAKDLPRDSDGKIIIDLENPHIIEDADYFRQPALHYIKHGCYTFLKPNGNPQSEYRKFWEEERRRIREGYIRKSDGEWVTGFCYWFLNYTPMMVNIIKEGTQTADRIESFPFFFEGIYWRFHYLYKAKLTGKHAIELAKRGAHPYFQKVLTPTGWTLWKDIKIGSYLFGTNGLPTKVVDIPYDKEAPYYKITLRDGREVFASDDHKWAVKIHCHKNLEILTTKELLDIYKKTREKSWRLPSGIEYVVQILNNNGVEFEKKETLIDAYTFGLLLGDGSFRHYSCSYTQLQEDMEEERVFIPYQINKWSGKHAWKLNIPHWQEILKYYKLNNVKSENKFIPQEFICNSKEVRLNILKGLMDTDGCAQKGRAPYFNTVSKKLAENIMEIARSLGYNTSCVRKKSGYKNESGYKECLPCYHVTIYGGKEIFNLRRKQECVEYKSSRQKGTMITNIEYIGNTKCKCVTVDAEDSCYLIGDFITTHNCAKSYSLASIMTHNLFHGESEVAKKRITTVLTAYEKEYLKDEKDGTLAKFIPMMDFVRTNTPFPRLMLKNSPNDMSWIMGYKDNTGATQGSRNTVLGVSAKDNPDKLRGKRGWILFEEMGAFRGLLALYDTTRRSVEDGSYAFACMYLVGTANEKESSFESAKTLLYKTNAYRIYTLKNVFDKRNQGQATFGFFFPAYVNRLGCFNKDGVSDVVKALLEIFMARYSAKYGTDPNSVLRVIAEDPITPAEAIIKVKNAYFPTTALTERLGQIDSNPNAFDDVYVGNLILKDGKVEFTVTNDTPIRVYQVDNSTKGAVEIFEMPERDKSGRVYSERYIIGHDPVDNDQADSSSLSSTIVLDLWTDRIVAEYTGRQLFADENYEICRLLCLFYNAKCLFESNKKGIYQYFQKMYSTHLLSETPQYLRDRQLVKYEKFGSNAYGVNANAAINNYANSLIRDWLLLPKTVFMKNEHGEDVEVVVQNLYNIRNRALLEELIAFAPEKNVDRIRALGMVMLLREEKMVLWGGTVKKTEHVVNEWDNDDFFKDNYDNRFDTSLYDTYKL